MTHTLTKKWNSVILIICFLLTVCVSASPWETIVCEPQNTPEQLAATDLQRYIAQVTGKTPDIVTPKQWSLDRQPAIVIGDNEMYSDVLDLQMQIETLGKEGFYLANKPLRNGTAILIAANDSEGVVNGIYGLLREVGFGFYMGSEVIPDSLPNALPESPILRKPILAVRGVLPWYNFFNSPTTWEPIDHRAFVDQMIRMGGNFIGFHTYDNEPFAAVEIDGRMQHGVRLLDTATSTWGTHPTPTSEFAFGIDKLFAHDYFGADSTRIEDADRAIRIEQDILRDALQYAKDRGLHPCMGFEIHGNPLDENTRDIFLKRFNHVLDQYPAIEYLWLWQPETMGATGFMPKSPDDPLMHYSKARRDTFERIVDRDPDWGAKPFYQPTAAGMLARATEGARLEQFAMLAMHALRQRENAPKLVISGWGADQRLLSAEYYEGLDQLLPEDVVFSSLDSIKGWQGGHVPWRDRVDFAYHDLPPARKRWPTIWLEGDGDLWHPQPGVYKYCEGAARDIEQSGSQGFLAIHWRTREAETCYAYMMQYAWDPTLTADAFFADLAKRCYGPVAEEITPILIELDKMFYRWIGGEGQAECGEFRWDASQIEKVEQLKKIRERLRPLLADAGSARPRVQWLLDRMDWVLSFRDVQAKAIESQKLLVQTHNSDEQKAKKLAQQVLNLLDGDDFAAALRSYAKRTTTRGEYGVLATINTKALFDWRKLRNEAQTILGIEQEDPRQKWDAEAEIVVPRFYGSVEQGKALSLEPLVLGGGKAFVHYRRLGNDTWQTSELNIVKGWVQRATIPAEDVQGPGLEIAFSFSQTAKEKPQWGPVTITVMPAQSESSLKPEKEFTCIQKTIEAVLSNTKDFVVNLKWKPVWQADFYRVYRNEKLLVETAVTEFFDNPPVQSGEYIVQAIHNGEILQTSNPVAFELDDIEIKEVPEVTAVPRDSGVFLSWAQTQSPFIAHYQILRRSNVQGEWQKVAQIPAFHNTENRYFDRLDTGTYEYNIAAVSCFGKPGTPAKVSVKYSKSVPTPLIEMSLKNPPADTEVIGKVDFANDGAHFIDGYFDIPYNEKMSGAQGLTVEFEISFDSLDRMQVPLCHGRSGAEGWFAQLLGSKLTFCTPAYNASSSTIEIDTWYNVRWVFDGTKCHLFMNGENIEAASQSMRLEPSIENIRVGTYCIVAPSFTFTGKMRNLRIYDDILLEPARQ